MKNLFEVFRFASPLLLIFLLLQKNLPSFHAGWENMVENMSQDNEKDQKKFATMCYALSESTTNQYSLLFLKADW